MIKKMSTINFKIKQFPLKFKPRTDFGRDDFLVADCNREALNMVEMWPNWPFFAVVLYGPEGCGKSHLAHVFAEHVAACCEFLQELLNLLAIYSLYGFLVVLNHIDAEAVVIG